MNTARRWNDAVLSEPGQAPAFLDAITRAGVIYGDRPLCRHRRPHIIPESLALRYAGILGCFHQAIRHARAMIVDDGLDGRPDSLAVRIGVDPRAIELAAINPGYPSAAVLARVDSFHAGGYPWMIELNAESPAGMAYGDALIDLFLRDPLLERFGPLTAMRAADTAIRGLVETYRAAGGTDPRPRVAIVDLPGVPTRPEFDLFQAHFHRLDLPCEVCGPADLEYDGTRLLLGGERVDLVYRRLLVADVLENEAACRPLLDAYRARHVVMVNSLRTALLHGKGLFAMLHDPMVFELLPEAAQRMIRRHIPWTAILGDEPGIGTPEGVRDLVRKRPEKWVIKPLVGHGGRGVVPGWEVDSRTWERTVDKARHHVVQRRIEDLRETFPLAGPHGYEAQELRTSLDPFLVHGRLAGFLCRLSDGPLGNVSTGASQVPVFVAPDT